MTHTRTFLRLLSAALVAVALWGLAQGGGPVSAGEDKKAEKGEKKKRGGVVVGTLTAIDKKFNYIEVKADGEEKARRYVPRWIGGLPGKGGGLDQKMVKQLRRRKRSLESGYAPPAAGGDRTADAMP